MIVDNAGPLDRIDGLAGRDQHAGRTEHPHDRRHGQHAGKPSTTARPRSDVGDEHAPRVLAGRSASPAPRCHPVGVLTRLSW